MFHLSRISATFRARSIEEEVRLLYAFFPPFFFAFIGIELNLDSLFGGHALLLLAAITVIAAVSKYVPAYRASRRLGRREATVVGVGMVPRGEVGMSILTTLIAPFVLRRITRRGSGRHADQVPLVQ